MRKKHYKKLSQVQLNKELQKLHIQFADVEDKIDVMKIDIEILRIEKRRINERMKTIKNWIK